jgi:transcriptional regulator, XRE family
MSMLFSKSVKIWKEGDTVILKKIEDLCRKNNISIAKLEKECGIGNATIRGWDTSSPKVENLKKVADYFGKDVSYFLKE